MNSFNPKDYWEDRLEKNFGLHGTGFIGLGKNYNKWMYRIRKRILLNKTHSLDLPIPDYEILDIGSGTGSYIDIWKDLGCKKIVGSDITNVAVKNLKKKYSTEDFFVIDIGDDLPKHFSNRKFDLISAFDILFHIVDDVRYNKAIQNVFSLLKPNGFFFFSENFVHNKTYHTQHQTTRSLHDTENIVVNNGFKIIERRPMFFLMNAPVDTENKIIKLIWRFIKSSTGKGETVGSVVGSILYPIELSLASIAKESPTTEIMICKKTS